MKFRKPKPEPEQEPINFVMQTPAPILHWPIVFSKYKVYREYDYGEYIKLIDPDDSKNQIVVYKEKGEAPRLSGRGELSYFNHLPEPIKRSLCSYVLRRWEQQQDLQRELDYAKKEIVRIEAQQQFEKLGVRP